LQDRYASGGVEGDDDVRLDEINAPRWIRRKRCFGSGRLSERHGRCYGRAGSRAGRRTLRTARQNVKRPHDHATFSPARACEGEAVGVVVGSSVGVFDGDAVDFGLVGVSVGVVEGSRVGTNVGVMVGTAEGVTVGLLQSPI
jgi:hypothetical protein